MQEVLLAIALGVVAAAYAAVGQAGGTGYVAVLSLASFAPEAIKTSGLALNIMVSAVGCFYAYRARLLSWRSCYPFAILGAPFSVVGGAINLPTHLYSPLLGALLLVAALLMFRSARGAARSDATAPANAPFVYALVVGGVIGLLSGVTGVGGGIYLAPLLLLFHWTATKQAAAITTVFNLMNSVAALGGVLAVNPVFPTALPVWLIVVAIGAFAGASFGLRLASPRALRLLLGTLLLAAASRMIYSTFFVAI
ncbi:MAG TPA: sulfite exporter TauE/SafE family protein [Xanthobacteraceae bacterium]|nr:sulfite exporter TauE/SafE family protein [Xanthobacteraceae bacterium]